jgi:pyrroline-5-carboxylate reductase
MVGQLLLIGCGRMGGSLLRCWFEAGTIDRALAVDPVPPPTPLPAGVELVGALELLGDPLPDTIVLAVKPQMLDPVLAALRPRLPRSALVISIAAGKTLSYFAERLGASVATVRAMPNTPASIGRGMTVCCAGLRVDAAQKKAVSALMAAAGEVAWLDDESLMHAVTAVSGSGPAYVFHLIEALAAAGEAVGLPAELARRLARQTVAGSGELARLSPDAPAKLRAAVTSPGGTTAAALQVLMAPGEGLTDLMTRAVAEACRRSRELSGEG